MLKLERQEELLRLLADGHVVTVRRLAKQMYTSEATVRRDLKRLEEMNLVRRTYGGAVLLQYANRTIPIDMRRHDHRGEKTAAARLAAACVQDGDVLFMDGSSTVLEMARFLQPQHRLTVVTNSVRLASVLTEQQITVYMLGGQLLPEDTVCVGEFAIRMARQFRADKLFFSCAGLREDGEITDYSEPETALRRVLMEQSRERYFVCDEFKLGKTFCFHVCRTDELDGVFCSTPLPPSVKFRQK